MSKTLSARILVPVAPDMVEALDAWWRSQSGIKSRADAVRHLIEKQLNEAANG